MRFAPLLIALSLTTVAYADEPKQPEAREQYRAGAAAFTTAVPHGAMEFSGAAAVLTSD